MQMEHRLAGVRADVVHRAVAVLDAALAAEFRGDQVRIADDLGIFRLRGVDSGKVLLRNNQDVGRRRGIDVLEGKHLVVFINFLRGNLPLHNAAKDAVIHK